MLKKGSAILFWQANIRGLMSSGRPKQVNLGSDETETKMIYIAEISAETEKIFSYNLGRDRDDI